MGWQILAVVVRGLSWFLDRFSYPVIGFLATGATLFVASRTGYTAWHSMFIGASAFVCGKLTMLTWQGLSPNVTVRSSGWVVFSSLILVLIILVGGWQISLLPILMAVKVFLIFTVTAILGLIAGYFQSRRLKQPRKRPIRFRSVDIPPLRGKGS